MSAKPSTQSGIEDQLWPIVCATVVLMGVLTVVVWQCSDFDDERLVFNGYTHLAAVGLLGAAIIAVAAMIKGTARRTAELAILLSLALHAVGGLSAVYLFNNPIAPPGSRADRSIAVPEIDDDPPPPDYHWGQKDDEPEAQQAFEKPMETVVRDQAAPAANVQPRDVESPQNIADAVHRSKPDMTPPAAPTAALNKPLDLHRPEAAKVADLPPPDVLAMVRQKGKEPAIPDESIPAAEAPLAAPKAPPKTIEAKAMQTEKAERPLWAKRATRIVDPSKETLPSPDDLPSPKIIDRLPSQVPSRTSAAGSGPDAANDISREAASLVRADRGNEIPSAVLPDAGLPPRSNPSPVANHSHAPLGPQIASPGRQEFAQGSSPLPTRRGVDDGTGRALPFASGDSTEDPGELRSGSPGSDLRYGLAQPAAPARRAAASQTESGGDDPSSGPMLPRTLSEMANTFSSAAPASDDPALSGAGSAAKQPGGSTKPLDANNRITVRHVAGNANLRGNSRGNAHSGDGAGDIPLNSLASADRAPLGAGPAGPRRVDQGGSGDDDKGTSDIKRASGPAFDPRAAVDPAAPDSGDSAVSKGPAQGSSTQGAAAPPIRPGASASDTGRLYGPGDATGARRDAPLEPAGTGSSGGASPRPFDLAHPTRQDDRELDQTVPDPTAQGIARARGQIALNVPVHESLDAYVHGPPHGGAPLGDAGDGQLTEPAIERGLEYFARTQFPDGHWSLHEAPPGVALDAGSLGELHADAAATGLALLTFMAAGYTHEDQKYRQTVRRGLDWLVKHQLPDGSLSYRGSPPTHFYSQGIATMALCEAYGMTRDRDLREPAQKAIDFIVASQDPDRGGWRYIVRQGADTSVTGWQLLALKSAHYAELNVPDATIRKVGHWLDLAQVPGRGTYVYNPWNLDTEDERKGRAPNPTMTAQAMVMRMYLGQDKDRESLRQGADYLLAHLPEPGGQETALRDCYYWYYCNQAMYLMRGDYWKAWDARVTPLVRSGQVDRGPMKGSWSGSDPVPDIWNVKAGRHYVTAMHVLTLEFRYWHLPLFRELRREGN